MELQKMNKLIEEEILSNLKKLKKMEGELKIEARAGCGSVIHQTKVRFFCGRQKSPIRIGLLLESIGVRL